MERVILEIDFIKSPEFLALMGFGGTWHGICIN
jgi:hypothetical protein